MTETVGREIELDGVDPRELYGAQDVWLEQIRELHPALKIIARGSTLRVLGPREQTERFARRMEGLAAYYLKYGHISSEVVAQSFAGEVSVCGEPTEGDVLLIGNGGDELLFDLALAWGGPGRTCLNFPPTFSVYAANARLTNTAVVDIARTEDFSIDEEAAFERLAVGDIDYVIVASPWASCRAT